MIRVVIRLAQDRVCGGVKLPAGSVLGEVPGATLAPGVDAERLRLWAQTQSLTFESIDEPEPEAPAGRTDGESAAGEPEAEAQATGPDAVEPARRARGAKG